MNNELNHPLQVILPLTAYNTLENTLKEQAGYIISLEDDLHRLEQRQTIEVRLKILGGHLTSITGTKGIVVATIMPEVDSCPEDIEKTIMADKVHEVLEALIRGAYPGLKLSSFKEVEKMMEDGKVLDNAMNEVRYWRKEASGWVEQTKALKEIIVADDVRKAELTYALSEQKKKHRSHLIGVVIGFVIWGILSIIFTQKASAQQITPSVMLGAGMSEKGYNQYLEAGIWKKYGGMGVYGGVWMYNTQKEITKNGITTKEKSPIADPFVRAIYKIIPRDECNAKLINAFSLFTSKKGNYGGSYRLCWRDYNTMLCLEPFWGFKTGAGVNAVICFALN